MAKIIEIAYRPRKWAIKFLHDFFGRFIVLVLHRRAGKTTAVLNHIQRYAVDSALERERLEFLIKDKSVINELLRKRRLYAYIAPTYKQAKNIAWQILKDISKDIPGLLKNEAELYIQYPNGSRITLFGSENVDALRGIGLAGGASDEDSQQPSNLFSEVISKCLADFLGFWIFLGTPKGKNEFYRRYKNAQTTEGWQAVFRTIDDSLREEEDFTISVLRQSLEDDRKIVEQGLMTQEEFDQEWYCSFESAVKGAIFAKALALARKERRIGGVPHDASQKVFTVWDLGKGANMAVGFYQRSFNQVKKIDYWEGSGNEGLPTAIKVVLEKSYVYGGHFAPHDINAIDLSTGKTRIEAAKKLGIDFKVVPMMRVNERINAGQLMFSKLWIDENKCIRWLDAISQYQREWDEKLGKFKDEPLHNWASHGADEFTYAAIIENQMVGDDNNIGITWEMPPKSFDPYA